MKWAIGIVWANVAVWLAGFLLSIPAWINTGKSPDEAIVSLGVATAGLLLVLILKEVAA